MTHMRLWCTWGCNLLLPILGKTSKCSESLIVVFLFFSSMPKTQLAGKTSFRLPTFLGVWVHECEALVGSHGVVRFWNRGSTLFFSVFCPFLRRCGPHIWIRLKNSYRNKSLTRFLKKLSCPSFIPSSSITTETPTTKMNEGNSTKIQQISNKTTYVDLRLEKNVK